MFQMQPVKVGIEAADVRIDRDRTDLQFRDALYNGLAAVHGPVKSMERVAVEFERLLVACSLPTSLLTFSLCLRGSKRKSPSAYVIGLML